jgi:hypothetical protein
MPVRLDADDIEAIADRVAAKLRRPVTIGLIEAEELAELLGVSRDWVYANKRRLGAIAIGEGERPRLRFDVERVRAVIAGGEAGGQPRPEAPARRRTRRARESTPEPAVKPIRARPSR